jgi:hypothetical protein
LVVKCAAQVLVLIKQRDSQSSASPKFSMLNMDETD